MQKKIRRQGDCACLRGEFSFKIPRDKSILIAMRKKVVFFDIDGTLTDIEGNVPQSAVQAVHRAQENGVLCVVNTGRPYAHIVNGVKEIGFDGYVCSCGQHLIYHGKTVFRHRADRTYSRFIARTAEECRVDLFGEAEEATWGIFSHAPDGPMKNELERFRKRGMTVYSSIEEGDLILDKFCAWCFSDSDRAGFIRAVSGQYTSTGAEGALLEFVLNGHSKQSGGEAFMRLVGADREDVYALGDSVNDLPMFRAAAHTAAMQQSDPRLIETAEYVTGGVHSNGVSQALEFFELI